MTENSSSSAESFFASGKARKYALENHRQIPPHDAVHISYRVRVNICLPADKGWRADITENLSYEAPTINRRGEEQLTPFSHDITYTYRF